MKHMLLLSSALIVVPAWAQDTAVASATQKPMALEIAPTANTKIAPSVQQSVAMQTAPVAEPGVVIELKGSAKSTSALVAALEKDAAYKDAACSVKPVKPARTTAKITCAKANGALLTFLSTNAKDARWSISPTRLMSTTTYTCIRTTCGGLTQCFLKGCLGSCSPC